MTSKLTGVSSPDPANIPGSFPRFDDGDVVITSLAGMTWRLHSNTLRNASHKFKEMLDSVPGRTITVKNREEGKVQRWRLEMRPWKENREDARFRDFEIYTYGAKPAFRVAELNAANEAPFHHTYDNLFRCIYSINPIFTSHENSQGAYFILDSISLLQAAESLEAAKTVRLVIEAHLQRLGQTLWYHIERNSEAWADIAVRLESPVLFREAMLHIIGKFDLGTRGDIKGIDKNFLREQENGRCILELATQKAKELKEKKLMVERTLMDFYPKKMIHGETNTDVPGRAVYATDIYLWQALTLVRQYLNSCILANMHHRHPDGGVNFYRCIGAGGEAYLRIETLARFHESFGMSAKGKQCLQASVEFIKDCIKPIVEELLVDHTQTNRGPDDLLIPYLTCAEILDEELPWIVRKAQAKRDADNKAKADATAAEKDTDGDDRMDAS